MDGTTSWTNLNSAFLLSTYVTSTCVLLFTMVVVVQLVVGISRSVVTGEFNSAEDGSLVQNP